MSLAKVSKLAGVSIATVSRVINRRPGVNAMMVQAVHNALRETGYSIPSEGRVGRPRRSPTGVTRGSIALLIPDSQTCALRTTLSGKILHAVQEDLQPRGINMVVSGLLADGNLPACIANRQVDGVIVRSGGANPSGLESMSAVPHVWMLERPYHPTGGDVILEDNPAIGQLAANYLHRCGHKAVAFLNIAGKHPSFTARKAAFLHAAMQRGLSAVDVDGVFSGEELLRQLAPIIRGATGLFVPGADDEVRTVYRALQTLKVCVGQDVTLISCNNDEERLATLDPNLPNIDIQAEEIAKTAVETLLWRLKHRNEPQRRILVEPKLVEPFRKT